MAKHPKPAAANAYALVVKECREHGGPTERCSNLYRRIYIANPITRARYWEAVQEGTNQHYENNTPRKRA